MSGDVATKLSNAMPHWAVIPLVLIICLFLAAIIMGAVSVAGRFCGCRSPPPAAGQSDQQSDLREIRPYNASYDTMALVVIRPPPPAYPHPSPPQYETLFMKADAVERGVYGGNSQVAV